MNVDALPISSVAFRGLRDSTSDILFGRGEFRQLPNPKICVLLRLRTDARYREESRYLCYLRRSTLPFSVTQIAALVSSINEFPQWLWDVFNMRGYLMSVVITWWILSILDVVGIFAVRKFYQFLPKHVLGRTKTYFANREDNSSEIRIYWSGDLFVLFAYGARFRVSRIHSQGCTRALLTTVLYL